MVLKPEYEIRELLTGMDMYGHFIKDSTQRIAWDNFRSGLNWCLGGKQ